MKANRYNKKRIMKSSLFLLRLWLRTSSCCTQLRPASRKCTGATGPGKCSENISSILSNSRCTIQAHSHQIPIKTKTKRALPTILQIPIIHNSTSFNIPKIYKPNAKQIIIIKQIITMNINTIIIISMPMTSLQRMKMKILIVSTKPKLTGKYIKIINHIIIQTIIIIINKIIFMFITKYSTIIIIIILILLNLIIMIKNITQIIINNNLLILNQNLNNNRLISGLKFMIKFNHLKIRMMSKPTIKLN